MKLTDLLSEDTIILQMEATTKASVLDELIEVLDIAGKLTNKKAFREDILKREGLSTTGIEKGIAIPHAKSAAVKVPAIALGRSKEGIEFQALDQQPSHLFFMIAASEAANEEHLETLSRLSVLVMDDNFRVKLLEATTKSEIIALIAEKELENEREPNVPFNQTGKILAVTACPTGIAHTYMAANALKAKAQQMQLEIKVETNGSTGVKNPLTKQDIEQAQAIVVAADTRIDMERFLGKRVIRVSVADAIKKPDELLDKAVHHEIPVFEGDNQERGEERNGFYKHLMNGVSHMLPFVVGGGILLAISYMFGIKAFDPHDPSYHPIAGALKTIGGGNAFGLMVPVLAGFIAMSIADRPGFAPGMVGGLIAASGGAGFLGGIIAGFLAGYIVQWLKHLFRALPQPLEGIKPVLIYPLIGIFATGIIMLFFVIDPVKALNTGLQDWLTGLRTGNLVLLGLLLGGMMAVDMGGPINKAAFTFGIAMIDAGNFAPHAAIMAGGMTPPLGLAIATSIFKTKFTKAERDAGKTNYIMGASFITEGAIPFAAADPGRVIPSIIIGSAIAGALSMVFGIGLPAPHGGVFVIPIVTGNPLLYIAAILIGAIVTALMVGLLKGTRLPD